MAMSLGVLLMVIMYLNLFAKCRPSWHVSDFKSRNKLLTAQLRKQGYRYRKLRKGFYRRHYELIEKYHVDLKRPLQQGISDLEFYGDLVYKL